MFNVYKYSLHTQQITKYKQFHDYTELRLAQSLGTSAGDSSLNATKISLKLGLACGADRIKNYLQRVLRNTMCVSATVVTVAIYIGMSENRANR